MIVETFLQYDNLKTALLLFNVYLRCYHILIPLVNITYPVQQSGCTQMNDTKVYPIAHTIFINANDVCMEVDNKKTFVRRSYLDIFLDLFFRHILCHNVSTHFVS